MIWPTSFHGRSCATRVIAGSLVLVIRDTPNVFEHLRDNRCRPSKQGHAEFIAVMSGQAVRQRSTVNNVTISKCCVVDERKIKEIGIGRARPQLLNTPKTKR